MGKTKKETKLFLFNFINKKNLKYIPNLFKLVLNPSIVVISNFDNIKIKPKYRKVEEHQI